MWIDEVKEAAPSETVIVMAGNKMETPPAKHKVSLNDAQALARQNGLLHTQEVSAKSNEGINNLFLKVANLCWERKDTFQTTEVRGTFKLAPAKAAPATGTEKKKGCCWVIIMDKFIFYKTIVKIILIIIIILLMA